MSGRVSSQPSRSSAPTPSSINKQREPSTNLASKTINKLASSASLIVSMGRTRGVQCHRCKGYGHIKHDCPNKRVLVVNTDGGYSSGSDFDVKTHALLAANDTGSDEPIEEQIGVEDAAYYESLIVHHVLSAQAEKA